MGPYVCCDECDSTNVAGRVNPHDTEIMQMTCRDCGFEWNEYND